MQIPPYFPSSASLTRSVPKRMVGEKTHADVTVIYVGNERGDILAAHLSPSELAELSSDARGPVPCQRRSNHNPYRAVRVKLTPQKASVSFQSACRAQRQAVAGAGTKNFGKGGKGRGNVLLRSATPCRRLFLGRFCYGSSVVSSYLSWRYCHSYC